MSTTDMCARDVMTLEVLGIVPSAPLDVALRMMVEAAVHHLPVVDRGHCLGLAHESDVLWRLFSTAGSKPPTVDAVVRTPPLAVAADDSVRVVARRMVEAGTDAALVLQDGKLVGIVTGIDLLRLVAAGWCPESEVRRTSRRPGFPPAALPKGPSTPGTRTSRRRDGGNPAPPTSTPTSDSGH